MSSTNKSFPWLEVLVPSFLSPFITRAIIAPLLVILVVFSSSGQQGLQNKIMTVNGPIHPEDMGRTLVHEHVFLDWNEPGSQDKEQWDSDAAFQVIVPFLKQMAAQNISTFFECTPAYLGRNPNLLKRLSDSCSLHVVTNTGYYAARDYKHLPGFFDSLSASQIAEIWIAEFTDGIEGSQIRPGIIKIGVDSKDELTPRDIKLVRAAAKTHLATGLTIVAHTGDDTTATQELAILEDEGVSPQAFVWTHAQRGTSAGHLRHARRGCWISLDGLGWAQPTPGNAQELKKYGDFLLTLKQAGLLSKTLISHDAGWYTVGAPEQDRYKGYTLIFDRLMPYLNDLGFSQQDWDTLLVTNPQNAYALKVRSL